MSNTECVPQWILTRDVEQLRFWRQLQTMIDEKQQGDRQMAE